jgi:hypothetical protein
MRSLSNHEKEILDALLNSLDFPGRVDILEQLTNAQVEQIDPGGSLRFIISSDKVAFVKSRIPVEAEFLDTDGVHRHILLHVLNGKIDELEFYKDDSSPVMQHPHPENLRVMIAVLKSQEHRCPVCGYLLGFRAWADDSPSYEICPSCGIQFGYTDWAGGNEDRRAEVYRQWRKEWIAAGMPWWSAQASPPDWNPVQQLQSIGFKLEQTN